MVCLDNLITGKYANIAHLVGNERSNLLKETLETLILYFGMGNCDAVNHQAALGLSRVQWRSVTTHSHNAMEL